MTPPATLAVSTPTNAPRLDAILREIETDITAAQNIATDDELPDELFSFEERAEISRRLTGALAKLRRLTT